MNIKERKLTVVHEKKYNLFILIPKKVKLGHISPYLNFHTNLFLSAH